MNILINENQLEFLEKYNFYKELIFKYWDKTGAKIGDHFFHLFDLRTMGLHESNIYPLLTEYLGREESIEIAKNLLVGTHSIGFNDYRCGSYNYTFTVTNSKKFNKDSPIFNKVSPIHEQIIFEVDVLVNLKDAEVTLIHNGETWSLEDALGDSDIGWEVEEEVRDCIFEYFHDKITKKSGIGVEIDELDTTIFM